MHSAFTGEVMPRWREIGDDASANEVVVCGAGQSPVRYGDLIRKGSVELPVDGPNGKVQWDFKLPCDLSKSQGIEFDILCDDMTCLQGAMFYFKSGKGWYTRNLPLEEDGEWCHVRMTRLGCSQEGKPDGWGRIEGLRINFFRGGDRKVTTARVADFAIMPCVVGKATVAVLQGRWASRRPNAEANAILSYAKTMSSELSGIGVANVMIPDEELSAARLADVKVLVLPYNPGLPPGVADVLKDFVARGGKLFVCYSLPNPVRTLLGVKSLGMRRPGEEGTPIAGLLRQGEGLPRQPEFVPQGSPNTVVPELTGEGMVIARWADAGHKSLGLPALLRTPTGVYMSHVWYGDRRSAKRDLLKAICSSLDRELNEGFAAADAERAHVEAEVREFVKTVPSRKGERRLAWCHRARGLAGCDWDYSVRFLKENGFTDLIANLTWADRAYYASKVLPVDSSVATQGDALEQCLAACRKYGIKCHVWRVCYNTGGQIDKDRAKQFEDEGRFVKMFDAKSKSPWGRTFCPSHPENIRLEVSAMEELAAKGIDGIHFDYIRYADQNFCFCNGCRERFERDCGVSICSWPQDVRSDKTLARKWADWRCSNISHVVREVSESVRKNNPGVEISAAVRSSISGAYTGDGQDWVGWAKNGWVDFLCPMDYTTSTAFFRTTYLDQAKAIAGTWAKLYPGIGLSCWPDDGTEAMKMSKHIRALRKDGLEGFTVFALDARAELSFPILATGPTRAD